MSTHEEDEDSAYAGLEVAAASVPPCGCSGRSAAPPAAIQRLRVRARMVVHVDNEHRSNLRSARREDLKQAAK